MGIVVRGFTAEQENAIWDLHRGGESSREISRVLGTNSTQVKRFLSVSGGIRPAPRRRRAGHLTEAEREDVSRGIAAGASGRTIADHLGRSPSTISREIARSGGRGQYRAVEADTAAFVRARRPKTPTLVQRPILRALVVDKLDEQWSPQQISVWLRRTYPDHPQMHISHETIYRYIYIPAEKCSPKPCFTNCVPIARFAGREGRNVPTDEAGYGTWCPSNTAAQQPTTGASPGISRATSSSVRDRRR